MFAEALKQAMEETGIRASELALRAHVSRSCVSQYLSGKITPGDETRARLAEALNTSFEPREETAEEFCGFRQNSLTVVQAARILGKPEQFVRVALQTGSAPFGFAAKSGEKWVYHISLKLFYDYIGRKAV
jgi:transcriptional regulator with XRE-family HTH domain